MGLIAFFAGLVLVVLGVGMWQSPEMDWQGFLLAWSSVTKEIGRLVHDPFAILGIFVVTVGALIALRGLWGVVRGSRSGNKGGK
jgi:uncharacterized protein YjeT (DUF2065 family)